MKLTFTVLIPLTILAAMQTAKAELVTGLTQSNQLVNFDTSSPGLTSTVTVTGLVGGDVLNGIDARPLNGALYGFAVSGTTGRLYNIDRITGSATLSSTLNTAVNGNFFGIDFNPTVDRLRIVSDTGQNLRVNVTDGVSLVDGNLQFAAGDANSGTPPQVVAAAYSNNVASAVSTTLYTMDLSTQSLLTQVPPNNGTLNTIGALSGILFPEAAFDISGLSGVAYAILNGFELATVNLATGATTSLGAINAPGSLIGLATVTAIPEPSSILLVTLGTAVWLGAKRQRQRSGRLAHAHSPKPE
ncbi:MAG: DUF4394 domain-containing protein [Pirellulaceae bacterium]|nr:DUF4394 domain-containing protein [Pirellulaceae bacterium]